MLRSEAAAPFGACLLELPGQRFKSAHRLLRINQLSPMTASFPRKPPLLLH
jgi:hypothetical protein